MKYFKISLTKSERRRVFSKISVDPDTKCWNWQCAKDKFGYGFFRYKRQTYRIHRFIYAWLVKPIPTAKYGKNVPIFDHLCKNKSCCNPKHLELVPQKINMLRGSGPSAINARKTHCIKGHLLPKAREPYGKGKLGRRCILCRRANRMRRYYAKKSANFHIIL
jgi:hypothetical protein